MNRPKLALTLLAATLAALAAACAAPATGAGEPRSGAALWRMHCGECHNFRGASEYDDEEWRTVVAHMRVTANLPGDQARAIAAFLAAGN